MASETKVTVYRDGLGQVGVNAWPAASAVGSRVVAELASVGPFWDGAICCLANCFPLYVIPAYTVRRSAREE